MRIIVMLLALCAAGMALQPKQASAWDFPLSLDVTKVSFNYSGSVADTLKKDCGTTIVLAPEWQKYPGGSVYKNDRFAYTKSATPTVKATFTSPDPDPSTSVVINVATQTATSEDGFENYTGWSLNNGTITFPSGPLDTEGTFTTQSGTSVKNSVGKCRTKFLWRIYQVGNTVWLQDLGYSTHNYYTLLATPLNFVDYYQTPTRYGQPWTEVLDLSCKWLKGSTDVSGCAGTLTDSLYFYKEMKYDEVSYHTIGATSTFDLRHLLQDISNEDTTKCNCQDYSHFLNVLAYSIGCSSSLFQYRQILPDSGSDFRTKTLWPAQWGYSIITNWGMHQIVYYNTNTHADAATEYDYSGRVHVRGDYTWLQYKPLLTDANVKDGSIASTVVGSQ